MQKPPVFEHSARQAETSVAFAGAFAVPVAGFFAVAGGVAPWLVEVEGAWANRRPPSISPAATNFIEFELAGTRYFRSARFRSEIVSSDACVSFGR